MKVTKFEKSNGVHKFVLDNKVTYVYDSGGSFSISYALDKLLIEAYKNNDTVSAEDIAERI